MPRSRKFRYQQYTLLYQTSCKQAAIWYNSSTMQIVDLSKVFEPFKGMWVALTDSDQVISAHKSAKKVYDEAMKKGYKEPILFKVPLHDLPHIG